MLQSPPAGIELGMDVNGHERPISVQLGLRQRETQGLTQQRSRPLQELVLAILGKPWPTVMWKTARRSGRPIFESSP